MAHYSYLYDKTAPNRTLVTLDITAGRARYDHDYLVVTTRFVDLLPDAPTPAVVSHTLSIDGANQPEYRVVTYPEPDPFVAPHGAYLQKDVAWGVAGPKKRCRGIRAVYNYTRDFVRVRVPSRCLDNPAAVHVQSKAGSTWYDTNRGQDQAYDFLGTGTGVYDMRVPRG